MKHRSAGRYRFTAVGSQIQDETAHKAALYVCDQALDVDDARLLLDALGVLEPARHVTALHNLDTFGGPV